MSGHIDRQLFRQITEIIKPFATTRNARVAMIQGAFFGENTLLNQIDVDLVAAQFATDLTTKTLTYGEIDPGNPALVELLKYIAENYGSNAQRDVEAVLPQVVAQLGGAEAAPPPAPATPSTPDEPGQLPNADVPNAEKHIFISYASADRGAIVDPLADRLSKAGFTLWVDNVDPTYGGIVGGEPWKQALANALQTAAAVLLVITPESMASKWVWAEVERARELGKPILPVMFRAMRSDSDKANHKRFQLDDLHRRDFTRSRYEEELKRVIADLHQMTGGGTAPSGDVPTLVLDSLRDALNRYRSDISPVPAWAVIPGGTFTYGDASINVPEHAAELRPFLMALTPVTMREYAAFVSHSKHPAPSSTVAEFAPYSWNVNTPPPNMGDHPVVMVTLADAAAYCDWLTAFYRKMDALPDDWRVTLPSEIEWEFAARGTDGRHYPWGPGAPNTDIAHYEAAATSSVTTHPNGRSPFGLVHMSGNVWEWTRSAYRDYPYDSSDGRENPGRDDEVILRGGSWVPGEAPEVLRVSFRHYDLPDTVDYAYGFRPVVVREEVT
jgi:formylglycine-generating enzyme required for sulfatase activity